MLSVTKELDRVYRITTNRYDLGMLFLRYQEYYESDNYRFFRHKFTIAEFMSWYTKTHDKEVFTYPDDWCGFNIPTHMIEAVFALGIDDFNFYDHLMFGVLNMVKNEGGEDCYLIGCNDKNEAYDHEMAHALYYTNDSYRLKIGRLFFQLDTEDKTELRNKLNLSGYAESVIPDELQAYILDTDLELFWKDVPEEILELQQQVRNIFQEHLQKK